VGVAVALRRGPEHHWSGARISGGRQAKASSECFRCAEEGDVDPARAARDRLRRLFTVLVVREGSTLGAAVLCATCISSLVPLDPALDVTQPG
jgi:hypothetical protein